MKGKIETNVAGSGRLFGNGKGLKGHMKDVSICPRCKKADKTIMHALRDCETIKPLWLRMVNPHKWIGSNLQKNLGKFQDVE
ncbi:conserved hypothetical protein [Ricinus communis]|uniref:Reverse transcriptase zinc-binding domain-containing protein n=1 Tax=Ricinus communis TaxID=3988 RepID=B9S288_RICCO|nr:conserved hypothetical protein [Ricinus communis]